MSALPAAISISQFEDLILNFSFVDDTTGAAIDITGSGFGAFSLTLSPLAVYNISPVIFPSAGFSLALIAGTTNQIGLICRLANLGVMPPSVQFQGELIRTIPGAPIVTESWASVSVTRSSPPQSTDSIGSHAINVRRTAGNTVIARTSVIGPVGPAGVPNVLAIGTVTTLSNTSPATASITGTSPIQTLSFGIPQGPQGPPSSIALIFALG